MSEIGNDWKLPKNIRQVGDGSKEKKLYVEDYVVTYLNRLSEQKESAKAILLGSVKEKNLYPYIFVDAAIEIEDFRMDQEQKEMLEKQIRKEFGIKRTVGWFFSSKEAPIIYNQEVLDTFRQFFGEENQVLLVQDPLEEDLTAFFLEDEILTEQAGYQIYYEKNLLMQNRIMNGLNGEKQQQSENVKDDAIHRFRELIKLKKAEKDDLKGKKNVWATYVAGGFLMMTVLALGVTIIYNYDRMKQVEQSLALLTNQGDSQKEFVTDQAEAVMFHMEEEQISETQESMATEEETFTVSQLQSVAETESQEQTEETTQKETETEPDEAANGTVTGTARASYTIKVGDTLAGISEMYYGSADRVADICSLNGIMQEDTILPGQKILLP